MDTPTSAEAVRSERVRRYLFSAFHKETEPQNGEATGRPNSQMYNKRDTTGLVFLILQILLFVGLLLPIICTHYWFSPSFLTFDGLLSLPVTAFTTVCTALWWLWSELGWFLGPLIVGIVVTYYSWYIVYLDSYIPGRVPPAPFSPRHPNPRKPAGNTFHLNYVAALGNGILVFLFLLWRSIQYHTPTEDVPVGPDRK